MRLRLLTYNVHGWRSIDGEPNLEKVAQVIADSKADIVGLNEVYYPARVSEPQATVETSTLDSLAERLDMHFVFGPCLRWPATQTLPEHSYGNALLSRWPIIASAAHHLTPVEGKEQRGLLEARILLPDRQPFTVYVTHLDHTAESVRMTQLRALRSWTVRDRNRPHVVMGDFNAIQLWDYADRPEALQALAAHPKGAQMLDYGRGAQVILQMEKAGYTDAICHCGKAGEDSFLPAEGALRIDYIWISQPLLPGLRTAQVWYEPAGKEASDHRPVLAEVEFN
jgi:endonuclease/exonuclease/phosphatase family metal-dependent hydrolase